MRARHELPSRAQFDIRPWVTDTAPIIITATMGSADQHWADALRQAHFPPERNYLSAHITLFHHLPPAHMAEIAALAARLAREYPPPTAQLSEVISLGRGVAYRVHSPELVSIREEMAQAFRGLLTPQDNAVPRLHITVSNKIDPARARMLQQQLAQDFVPRALSITGLAAFHYRGGPWEPMSRWPFRG